MMSWMTEIRVAMPTATPMMSPVTRRVVSKWGNIDMADEPMLVAVPISPFSVVVK